VENRFDHIDELIGKYLAGEASASERTEVDNWASMSVANKQYIEQMKTVFNKAASIREWQQFDADAAWNKMKSRMQPSAKTVAMKPQRNAAIYWRVAASLLFILSVGYGMYAWLQKPTDMLAITSDKQSVQDTLPDGSMAFLNKGSAIDYHYDPAKKKRSVKLTGEVYFDVKHEETKPFIIETNDVIIEDIGTTFNVKAYPESPTIEVFVETGEVAFYTKENPGLRLLEGETGIYHKQSKSFARIAQSDTNVLSYKTRVFNFYNVDLGTVVESLNEIYEVKIKLANKKLESCRLNVSFKGEPIEVIADIIAETLQLTITKTENEFILDGSGCGEQ
jgi:transmembrane sensor